MPSAQRRRALTVASPSTIGEERYVAAGGQRIRVNVRQGTGVPLVLCNGIGASLEVLDPLVEQLNPRSTIIRFDVPGTGGSPTSMLPYGFPYLAWVLGRVLSKLEFGVVDVLGLSWGGALARRCRRTHGYWRKWLPRAGFRIPTTPHRSPGSCTAVPSGGMVKTSRNCSCGSCAPGRRWATCTSSSRVRSGPACSVCPRCASRR